MRTQQLVARPRRSAADQRGVSRPVLTITATVVTVLLAGTAGAGRTPPPRTVHTAYTAPGGVQDQLAGHYTVNHELLLGGFALQPTKSESRVSLALADTSGLPVPADLAEDINSDGIGDVHLASFCTSTSSPVRIKDRGVPLLVYVFAGTCDGLPATPTTGTAVAKFYR